MAKFYAVKKGKKTGIFSTWDECKEQVTGFKGAVYKSFKTLSEAEAFLERNEEKIENIQAAKNRTPPAINPSLILPSTPKT